MKAFTIRLSVFAIIVLYLSNLTMTESFMSELYQQKIDSTNSLAVPVGRDCNGLSRKESKSLSFWIPQKYDFWTTVNRTTHGSGTVTDFLDGTFDLTEVVQGSSQVTLSRRWTSNKNITSELAGIEQYYPYIVANENGDLYLIWQDERDGTADIYFSYSIDDGETWLSHTKINDENMDN
ncbi:MAG: hypothetical protein B6242_08565 [Anaerolineaceae bacterium 4572_78]|nr:MAG: hypothetical protein B6242_08565 [Anaerolineaceae bacterium 4572_78]